MNGDFDTGIFSDNIGPVDPVPTCSSPSTCHLFSGALTAIGLDATTAAVVAPALTSAVVGGGLSAATGGNPLVGAGIGAVAGGLGGYFFGPNAPGATTIGGSDTSGGLGNWVSSLFGSGDGATSGITLPDSGSVSGTADMSAPAEASAENPGSALSTVSAQPGGNPLSAASAADASGAGGAATGGKGGISNTALALGAISALGSMFSKPQINQQAMPGPAQTSVGASPLFNASLNTSVPGRTAINPLQGQPSSAWYTYGTNPPANNQFFTGNNLQNFGFAKGGLSRMVPHRVFETGGPSNYVRGPGGPEEDKIPARLSNGEYVLDHKDVAMLGGGSNAKGAKKLDRARPKLNRGDIRGALSELARAA